MKKYIKLLYFLTILSMPFFLGGCDAKSSSSQSESRRIVVGMSADYPPFEFKRKGEILGFDIDIAQAVAKELDCEIEFQDMDFSAIIPAIKMKRVDFSMTSMTATKDRMQQVDFSEEYYQPSLALLYREDAPVVSANALEGKKVGAQMGTIMELYVKKKADALDHVALVSFYKNPDLVQELKVGRVDVVVIEEAQAVKFSDANPELAYVTVSESIQGYAAAFPKDSALKDAFNETLEKLRASGKLEAIKNKWFDNLSSG